MPPCPGGLTRPVTSSSDLRPSALQVGGCELSSSDDFAGYLEDISAAAKHHESQHMSTHFKCRNMGDGCTLGFKTQSKLDEHHTHCGGQNSTCKTCADGDGPDANAPEYKELDCVPRERSRPHTRASPTPRASHRLTQLWRHGRWQLPGGGRQRPQIGRLAV